MHHQMKGKFKISNCIQDTISYKPDQVTNVV